MILVCMKLKSDHVAAHAAHHDAVADVEGLAAQDHEIARDGGDHPLQREGEAGGDQRPRVGQPGRIVEPDRDQAEDRRRGGEQADDLPPPEAEAGVAAFLRNCAQRPPQQPGQGRDGEDEADAEQQLAPVLRRRADQVDAEQCRRALRAHPAAPRRARLCRLRKTIPAQRGPDESVSARPRLAFDPRGR